MAAKPDSSQIKHITGWLQAGSINIFGLPFAGKDTQALRLAALLDAPIIGGGDILRSVPEQDKVKRLMSTGELFPSDYYLSVVLPFLNRPEFTNKPLILSSIGRWHGEEEAVINAASASGHPLKAVIWLRLDEQEVWKRWEATQDKNDRGHRHDDQAHILEVRLEEFRSKTLPVIDYYDDKGLVIEVDGSVEPAAVTNQIVRKLGDYIHQAQEK